MSLFALPGWSPLYRAVVYEKPEMVKLLIENGAEVSEDIHCLAEGHGLTDVVKESLTKRQSKNLFNKTEKLSPLLRGEDDNFI